MLIGLSQLGFKNRFARAVLALLLSSSLDLDLIVGSFQISGFSNPILLQ